MRLEPMNKECECPIACEKYCQQQTFASGIKRSSVVLINNSPPVGSDQLNDGKPRAFKILVLR